MKSKKTYLIFPKNFCIYLTGNPSWKWCKYWKLKFYSINRHQDKVNLHVLTGRLKTFSKMKHSIINVKFISCEKGKNIWWKTQWMLNYMCHPLVIVHSHVSGSRFKKFCISYHKHTKYWMTQRMECKNQPNWTIHKVKRTRRPNLYGCNRGKDMQNSAEWQYDVWFIQGVQKGR